MNKQGFMVLGKLNRDTQILGVFDTQEEAESVALDGAVIGMVSDTFVVPVLASFNEQAEVRARQQVDERTQSDRQAGVNPDPDGPAPHRTEADETGQGGNGIQASQTIVPASASGEPDTVLTAPSVEAKADGGFASALDAASSGSESQS